jgi:hypothetical protein
VAEGLGETAVTCWSEHYINITFYNITLALLSANYSKMRRGLIK